MYKTLSLIFKQAKNTRGANFMTKIKEMAKMKSTVSVIASFPKKTFCAQSQHFEKIAEKSMGPSKLNMKNQLIAENLNAILNFVEENKTNMNDGDFLDAVNLISMKLEGDINERINMNLLEKKPSFMLVKTFINDNFNKLATHNFSSQVLLSFYFQMHRRNRSRNYFTKEQADEIIRTNFTNLEQNHHKISVNSIVSTISLLGVFRGVNVQAYLKDREEELGALGFNNMLRYFRRLNTKGQNPNVVNGLSRFLTRDFFAQLEYEKIGGKAKGFNVLSRLNWENPYIGIHGKLSDLLRSIKLLAEEHDQFSILNTMEGLIYYDDPSKNEILTELYDIVTMTIKHQPDNIKGEFVIDFLALASQIRMDNSITHDHLKTMFNYVLQKIKQTTETTQRTVNSKKIVPIFTLMRKHKYTEKTTVQEFFDLIENRLLFLADDADISSVRNVCARVLGDEVMNKIGTDLVESLKTELAKPDKNVRNVFGMLYKASAFVKSANLETVFSEGIVVIENKFKEIDNQNVIFNFLDFYVNRMQEFLPHIFKVKMIELFLAKIDIEKIGEIRNVFKYIIVLTEINVVKEREDLKTKINAIVKKFSEDPNLKKSIINNFVRMSENNTNISNSSIYRILQILREFIKNEEFVSSNDRFFDKLVASAFNFLFNHDNDSSLTTDGIASILNFADHVHTMYPNIPMTINYFRFPRMLRLFNMHNIQSSVVNEMAAEFLNRDRNSYQLTSDNIIVLEKVCKSDLSKEVITKSVKKYVELSNINHLLDSQTNNNNKLNIIKLLSSLHKKEILVDDQKMKEAKEYLFDQITSEMTDNIFKLNALTIMTTIKSQIVNFQENSKEYFAIIKQILPEVNLRKLTKVIEGLPRNLGNPLVNRLHSEFVLKYDKEEKVDKNLFLRILDRFTMLKWTNPLFYNKIISDYEKNFKTFSSIDHSVIIQHFAKIELNKEDVLRASASNINVKHLSDWDKIHLFNSLVRLDFTNQEWKELILEKLVQELDLNFINTKASIKDKFNLLNSLWRLGSWPANHQQIVDGILQSINKYIPQPVKNVRYLANSYEDVIGLTKRSPYFSKFNEEIQKFVNQIFEAKKEQDFKSYTSNLLQEFLIAMGHSDLQIYPGDKLCDFYLPKNNVAIIFARKNSLSIINNNELKPTGKFSVEILKKAGVTPVIINDISHWKNYLNEKTNEETVQFLESLGITNNATDKKCDFKKIDSMKKPFEKRRNSSD